MSKAEHILQSLQAAGALESEGGFSIDKEKARDKMRQFQLPDPRRYVLLLVQAAVQQGASRIEFEIDADDMVVWFDGRGFSSSDLDELFVSLFGDRTDGDHRARQELALALNAALALNPRFVEVLSQCDGQRSSLVLRPGVEELPSPQGVQEAWSRGGTRVHVKDRFRVGLMLQFFRNVRGELAEEKILRERVRYATIPIALDGEQISAGIRLGAAFAREPVHAAGIVGEVGFVDPHPERPGAPLDPLALQPRLELLNAGVWLTTRTLPDAPLGFVAMVDGTHLRKDVSQTDVVLDETFAALERELAGACERCLHSVVRRCLKRPGGYAELPGWFRDTLPELIASRLSRASSYPGPPIALDDLRRLPIWPQLDGRKTTALELQRRAHVDYVTGEVEDELPEEYRDNLLAIDPDLRKQLEVLFGEQARDRTRSLAYDLDRVQRRRAFERREHPAVLGKGLYRRRVTFSEGGVSGEAGLREGVSEPAKLLLILNGKLLEELELPPDVCAVPGFIAAVEGPFSPTVSWDRAHRDLALATALHHVAGVVRGLLADEARAIGSSTLRAIDRRLFLMYLLTRGEQTFDEALYRAAGFSPRSSARWVEKLGAPSEGPLLHGSADEPLARLALFDTVDGRTVSLREIGEGRVRGKVRVVAAERPGLDDAPYLIVRVRKRQLDVLQAVFGERHVVLFGDGYQHLLSERAWQAKPMRTLQIDPKARCVQRYTSHGMTVVAGVVQEFGVLSQRPETAVVEVLKQLRLLDEVNVPAPIPGLRLCVDWNDAPVDSKWSSLQPKGRKVLWAVVDKAVQEMFLSLTDAHADAHEIPAFDAELLRLIVSIPFGHAAWLGSFHDLAHSDARQAIDRLDAVVRAGEALGKKMTRERGVALLEGQKYSEVIGSRSKERNGSSLRTLCRSIASRWPVLQHMPLFESVGGWSSLADVAMSARRFAVVFCVDDDGPGSTSAKPPRPVLKVDRRRRSNLERLLGKGPVRDGRAWVEDWIEQRAFEQQPTLDSLRLDAEACLVRVSVDEDGTRGEIGLPIASPNRGVARITACRQKRKICEVETADCWGPVVGLLDDIRFGKDRRYTEVSDRDIATMVRVCERSAAALVAEFAENWDAVVRAHPEVSREWALLILGQRAVGTRGRVARLSEQGVRMLADQPLFVGLDGERFSLVELGKRVRGKHALHYVPAPVAVAPEDWPEFAVVRVRSRHEQATLESVFGDLHDYTKVLDINRARRKAQADAVPMPQCPPSAIASWPLNGRGVEGMLWVDPRLDESCIALGTEAKVARFVEVSKMFVVAGFAHGRGVEIDEEWADARLARRAHSYVVRQAFELYDVIHDRFVAAHREAGAARAEVDVDRAVLREALVRMQSERSRGAKWSSGRYRQLFHSLCQLPLFEAGGRPISLRTMLDVRPVEFAEYWMLWDEGDESTADQSPSDPSADADGGEAQDESDDAPGAGESPNVAVESPEPELELELEPARSEPESKPEPTAEDRLLEAVRSELRLIRRGNARAVSDGLLDLMLFGELPGTTLARHTGPGIVLSRSHPVVRNALQAPGDSVWVSMLASSVYTAINLWLDDVTDGDEVLFHRLHAEYVAG